MVETISPVVHGGRTKSYWRAVLLHVLGALLSAMAFGALLGFLGSLVRTPSRTWPYVVLVVLALIYAAREALRLPIPVPDRHKQVPEWWRTFYSRDVSAFLYGLGLGVGFLTFLTFGTYVAVAFGAFVSGDVVSGAVICGAFGLARALALIAAPSVDSLEALVQTKRPRLVNATACAVVATGAGLALL